jgi:hypothetical protein
MKIESYSSNYKLDYITTLFQKISHKKIEHYVISRLWHKINNDEIEMIPQQRVDRTIDKIALTDVYFPQFDLFIEVNEPAHYSSDEKIEADKLRRDDVIKNVNGSTLIEIDCRQDLKNIHNQIDQIVDRISNNYQLKLQEKTFIAWDPEMYFNPTYWKRKKIIEVKDRIKFRTIEDICFLFDADFTKTKIGFQRRGGIKHPKKSNILIWWPSSKSRSGWENIKQENEEESSIIESHSDFKKSINNSKKSVSNNEIRYVFFHEKDVLGFVGYAFLGVYELDIEKSISGSYWKRISTKIELG